MKFSKVTHKSRRKRRAKQTRVPHPAARRVVVFPAIQPGAKRRFESSLHHSSRA
jgi:hypothetical protein